MFDNKDEAGRLKAIFEQLKVMRISKEMEEMEEAQSKLTLQDLEGQAERTEAAIKAIGLEICQGANPVAAIASLRVMAMNLEFISLSIRSQTKSPEP